MKYFILKTTKDAFFKAYDPVPELWGVYFMLYAMQKQHKCEWKASSGTVS